VTDTKTDRQTDRQTELLWCASSARAWKSQLLSLRFVI